MAVVAAAPSSIHVSSAPSFHLVANRRRMVGRNTISCSASSRDSADIPLPTRRQGLLLLSSAVVLQPLLSSEAKAEDIGLFGLRKKLRTIEKEAEVVLEEGEKALEQGLETAEKEIQIAEKEIQAAESGIEAAAVSAEVGLEGGLGNQFVQAAAIAAAEAIGVLVGVSVVNGILGPEAQKS